MLAALSCAAARKRGPAELATRAEAAAHAARRHTCRSAAGWDTAGGSLAQQPSLWTRLARGRPCAVVLRRFALAASHSALAPGALAWRVAMSRGNQRDQDRKRAAARSGKAGSKNDDGLTPAQRNERCASVPGATNRRMPRSQTRQHRVPLVKGLRARHAHTRRPGLQRALRTAAATSRHHQVRAAPHPRRRCCVCSDKKALEEKTAKKAAAKADGDKK